MYGLQLGTLPTTDRSAATLGMMPSMTLQTRTNCPVPLKLRGICAYIKHSADSVDSLLHCCDQVLPFPRCLDQATSTSCCKCQQCCPCSCDPQRSQTAAMFRSVASQYVAGTISQLCLLKLLRINW